MHDGRVKVGLLLWDDQFPKGACLRDHNDFLVHILAFVNRPLGDRELEPTLRRSDYKKILFITIST